MLSPSLSGSLLPDDDAIDVEDADGGCLSESFFGIRNGDILLFVERDGGAGSGPPGPVPATQLDVPAQQEVQRLEEGGGICQLGIHP